MKPNRPLILVDLDDTLFQTARKMPQECVRHLATRDVEGQPNGYMSSMQKSFVDWLLTTADVVPVTARSIEAYQRVQLPFTAGAICAHGGVMLDKTGQLDPLWHQHMSSTLASVQTRLADLCTTTLRLGTESGYSLRGWIVEEAGLSCYVVIKNNQSDDAALPRILSEIRSRGLLTGMSTHLNGNNLAFLPAGLSKRRAVEEWLRRDNTRYGERPVLGLGDSITDLGFMDLCHLWGTPAHSQLATALKEALHE